MVCKGQRTEPGSPRDSQGDWALLCPPPADPRGEEVCPSECRGPSTHCPFIPASFLFSKCPSVPKEEGAPPQAVHLRGRK